MTEPTLSEINYYLNRLEKRLDDFIDSQERIKKERENCGLAFLNGMRNCGHDFLDNAQEAYESEKGQKAVDGIKGR